MQNHSKPSVKIVCDHYAGVCIYYALSVNAKRRFWRGEQEQKEFIASIEYEPSEGWKVNLPDFETKLFDTKEQAKTYIEALIALNY
jgi:hypothetical protein